MLKTILSISFFSLLICFNGHSQDSLQNKKVWSLEECINYALKNNLVMKRAMLSKENNKVSYEQAYANLLPSINASVSHSYGKGKNQDPTTGVLVDATSQSNSFNLNSNLTLFRGMQVQNTIKQNRAFYEASLADISQAEYTTSLNVTLAYLDIVLNKELLKAAQLQLQNSNEQVIRTEKLVKAGALPESNLLEVKAQQATEELNVVNAENAIELSKLKLLQLLLIEADNEFDIIIPEIPEAVQVPLGITSSEIYKISLSTQPSVRSADLNIKGARYSEMAAKGTRYPSISLNAGVASRYFRPLTGNIDAPSFKTQFNTNLGEFLGFQLNVPIFNNWQTRAQIQNAIINRRRAELNAIETKNTLRQNVEQAYTNAKTAYKRLNSSKKQVEALRETFRVNEQRFNVGAINSLDYTLSKNKLNQSESDLIRAKYDYIFRIKILDFYQNKPLTLD